MYLRNSRIKKAIYKSKCHFEDRVSPSTLEKKWATGSSTLKALLHQAIFRATRLTTFKSVALQLYEQGCYTVQWDCQQLAKLRPWGTEERIIRILIG